MKNNFGIAKEILNEFDFLDRRRGRVELAKAIQWLTRKYMIYLGRNPSVEPTISSLVSWIGKQFGQKFADVLTATTRNVEDDEKKSDTPPKTKSEEPDQIEKTDPNATTDEMTKKYLVALHKMGYLKGSENNQTNDNEKTQSKSQNDNETNFAIRPSISSVINAVDVFNKICKNPARNELSINIINQLVGMSSKVNPILKSRIVSYIRNMKNNTSFQDNTELTKYLSNILLEGENIIGEKLFELDMNKRLSGKQIRQLMVPIASMMLNTHSLVISKKRKNQNSADWNGEEEDDGIGAIRPNFGGFTKDEIVKSHRELGIGDNAYDNTSSDDSDDDEGETIVKNKAGKPVRVSKDTKQAVFNLRPSLKKFISYARAHDITDEQISLVVKLLRKNFSILDIMKYCRKNKLTLNTETIEALMKTIVS